MIASRYSNSRHGSLGHLVQRCFTARALLTTERATTVPARMDIALAELASLALPCLGLRMDEDKSSGEWPTIAAWGTRPRTG